MSTPSSTRRGWLTRNVWVLSAVSFLQDTASELLYPLLPIYLTSILGAPAAVVGAVEGAAEGAASLTKLASGPLSDRFSRRPLIASGYGMAALGKVMVAAATAWPGVLAGRVVDRLGKGLRGAPRDALLVADIDEAARGRVFGFHRAMDTFGAVIGPLLGLAGYELLDHQIAPLLWVAVVPAILSVALVFLVREKRPPQSSGARRAVFARVGELPRRYWRVTAVVVAFGLVNFPDALLLLRLNDIGFSVAEVILAYVGYNAVYALSSYPAGLVADRIGKPTVFGIGLVFFAVGYTGLGLTTGPADGLASDRRVRVVHRMHGWRWKSVGFVTGRPGSAGQRTGGVPGSQWLRGAGGGVVGRVRMGCGRSASAVDLRNRGRRRGDRGARDRDRRALPERDVDFEVVERERRRAHTGHRIATLRRALGDACLGADFTDGQDHSLRQLGAVGKGLENRSLPMVSTVDRVEVAGQPHPHRPFAVVDADRRGPVVDVAHRGRNPLRRHMRRAIGPNSPTSSRNAASGANPMIWVSRRWGLRRAVRRAWRASRPTRR